MASSENIPAFIARNLAQRYEQLRELAQSEDENARAWSLQTCRQISQHMPLSIPLLGAVIKSIGDENPKIQEMASLALNTHNKNQGLPYTFHDFLQTPLNNETYHDRYLKFMQSKPPEIPAPAGTPIDLLQAPELAQTLRDSISDIIESFRITTRPSKSNR